MKSPRISFTGQPRLTVVDGVTPVDHLRHDSTDYYDVFPDPAGTVHYKPGCYYYRAAMNEALARGDFLQLHGIAFAAFKELETLRTWVREELGYTPARWTVHGSEFKAKEGLHQDFIAPTGQEANAS